jgi:hypothetical protein
MSAGQREHDGWWIGREPINKLPLVIASIASIASSEAPQ